MPTVLDWLFLLIGHCYVCVALLVGIWLNFVVGEGMEVNVADVWELEGVCLVELFVIKHWFDVIINVVKIYAKGSISL